MVQEKISAKLVKKWPKNGQNTLSRPKKVQKCGFWPRKNFQPNWSKNGRKRLYLGPKRFKNMVFGPKKSVKTDAITPSMIENFEKNRHLLTKLKTDENGKKSKKLRAY